MKTYFKPADEREHAKGNRGEDVSDWCINCREPFMAHYNSECPPDENENEEETKPFWRCSECGYTDKNKAMPIDRAKFYSKPEPGYKCPKCKSYASFVPVGF